MMLKNILANLLAWLRLIPHPELLSRLVSRHPTPEEVVTGMLLIVKDGELAKWACFRCPCGCGQRIQLSLSQTN